MVQETSFCLFYLICFLLQLDNLSPFPLELAVLTSWEFYTSPLHTPLCLSNRGVLHFYTFSILFRWSLSETSAVLPAFASLRSQTPSCSQLLRLHWRAAFCSGGCRGGPDRNRIEKNSGENRLEGYGILKECSKQAELWHKQR